jgi:hypothetical protein
VVGVLMFLKPAPPRLNGQWPLISGILPHNGFKSGHAP